MRLTLFFQLSVCFSHLWGILLCLNMMHGNNYSLQCLNDYLFTIRCELNMSSEPWPLDALYWLEFYDDREPFECVLTGQTYPWRCVLNLSTWAEDTFMDTDMFQISLNYSFHGNNGSAVLKTDYEPENYIQPVPPSNLTLLWKPDEAVFHWLSGYDESIMLVPHLLYQLCIRRNDEVFNVNSFQTNMSVPTSTFAPNAKYVAHVRSSPRQTHYKGVWSHWGPTISWTTRPGNNKEEADTPDMYLATVCLAVILMLGISFCYISYIWRKRCVSNPGPAPHVGAFKNVGELLQREESLQIDSLTEEPNPTQYEKTSDANGSSGYTSFTGSPRSSSMLQSSVDSKFSMCSLMQVLMSAEKRSVTYSDDYCTLSQTLSEHAVNTHEVNGT